MSDRVCPWFEDDSVCGEPVSNPTNRVALCEHHSAKRRAYDQKNRGQLVLEVSELGPVVHTVGFSYVAEMVDGSWFIGYSTSEKYIATKLRKMKRDGELKELVTVLDGGESLALSLIARFFEYRTTKLGDYFHPTLNLTEYLKSQPVSDALERINLYI